MIRDTSVLDRGFLLFLGDMWEDGERNYKKVVTAGTENTFRHDRRLWNMGKGKA